MRHHATKHALRQLARQLAALIGTGYNSQPVAFYRVDPATNLLVALTEHEPGAISARHVAPYAERPAYLPRHD